MAALVTTASSISGPRVMTKPPTWVAAWRGKSRISSVSSSAMAEAGVGGVEPLGRGQRRQPHLVRPGPSCALASRAVTSSERPMALPTSRTALRVR